MSTIPSQSTAELDRESGLLPKDPPSRAAIWTGWLLLILSLSIAIFSATFKLPETVVAPFILVPAEGSDPIRAPVPGDLASILTVPGTTVKSGDELFRIRSDEIRAGNARLKRLEADATSLAGKILKLEESHKNELAIRDAGIAQMEKELVFREKHLSTAQELLKKAETLASSGLISEVELLDHRLTAAESEKDRVLADKAREQLSLEKQEKEVARARARIEEAAESNKITLEMATLREQLSGSTGEVLSVRAPYDAFVLSVSQRTPGSVVGVGTELCQLARKDSRLQVKITLPESGVPRVKTGQKVRLFFQAFPFQRHGSLLAEVTWISPAPLTQDGISSFTALATLQETGDSSLPVLPGMNGEARILLDRRTLLQRAIEPLKGLRERIR